MNSLRSANGAHYHDEWVLRSILIGLLHPDRIIPNEYEEFIKHRFQNPKWIGFLRTSGLYSFICYHLKKNRQADQTLIYDGLNAHFANTGKAIMMDRIVLELSDLFQSEKIKLVLTKGYILSRDYYCHVGCRPYGDLDFWIDPSHREKACQLLLSNGWTAYHSSGSAWKEHATFNHPGWKQLIELHWELIGLYGSSPLLRLDTDRFSPAYFRYTRINNQMVATFIPEIHYLHAMINWIRKGGWPPLKYLDLYFIRPHCRSEILDRIIHSRELKGLVGYMEREIQFYFGASRLQLRKPPLLSVVKTFRVPGDRQKLRLRYYLTSDRIRLMYDLFRMLIPSMDFLTLYYGSGRCYRSMMVEWWKEKGIKFFHRSGHSGGVSWPHR
ncbi:MAG: nucleotidyltransferase family protein [Candidatus Delongbacteria bacterium]|nr:nucleotidyltransferase family protein [Candidatus Delongbacteria bacterium]